MWPSFNLLSFCQIWDYTFKVVEGDLERVYERAEEFETKTRDLETQLREMESKVKETETITVKNADEEEKFENKITKLQDEFKQADTRSVLIKYSYFWLKIKLRLKIEFWLEIKVKNQGQILS